MDRETKEMFEVILSKLNRVESRQDEIYEIVKAIQHSNEVHKAELDHLKIRVSQGEGNFSRIKAAIK
ncbi:MAG: hypothetical protein PWQ96_695 [Clostridia bacterium]|jgi:hypothetical protein|nr:hypothetical protein [Clostridiales bacterium]MDK2985053.1 hypothetical protein [Clostridia bacterium]